MNSHRSLAPFVFIFLLALLPAESSVLSAQALPVPVARIVPVAQIVPAAQHLAADSVVPTRTSAPAAPVAPFSPTPGLHTEYWLPDGPIYAIEPDPTNGRVYLGGDFNYVGPYSGHMLALSTISPVGNLPDFPRVDGPVYAIAGNSTDGWYVGGDFSQVGDQLRQNLFRLTPALTLDLNWNPSVSGPVYAIELTPAGIYIGGDFETINNDSAPRLAKLLYNGATVAGWKPEPDGPVRALKYSENKGVLYVGGAFHNIAGQAVTALAELSPATGISTGWSTSLLSSDNPVVYALDVLPTSESALVLAGGDFSFSENNITFNNLAFFSADDGSTVNTLAIQPDDAVYALKIFNRANLYLGGRFTHIDNFPAAGLARINIRLDILDLTFDTIYHPILAAADGTTPAVYALSITDDGMLIGGDFEQIDGTPHANLARLDIKGTALDWDAKLQQRGGTVRAILPSGDHILTGGDFYSQGGSRRDNLAALDSSGDLVADWRVDAAGGPVFALQWFADRLFLGGDFKSVASGAETMTNQYVAQVQASTGALIDWYPDPDGPVYTLAGWDALEDGLQIILGGDFTCLFCHTVGQMRHNLAVVNIDSSALHPFNPGLNQPVYALQVHGPLLFAGGSFTGYDGGPLAYAAGFDLTFQQPPYSLSAGGPVHALAAAGNLIFMAEAPDPSLPLQSEYTGQITARRLADGQIVDPPFPAQTGQFRALDIRGSWVYAGGALSLDQPVLSAFARSNGRSPGWQPDLRPFDDQQGGIILALADANGRLFVGGLFAGVGNLNRPYLAVFNTLNEPYFLPLLSSPALK